MVDRRRRVLAAATVAAVLGLIAIPTDAPASTSLEQCFLAAINGARSDAGVAPLEGDSTLSAYGRTHSQEMAGNGQLYHSSPADLAPHLPDGWRSWGENVGYATGSADCGWLFQGFWDSPHHRDNILEPSFDLVGIGVFVDSADTMWTTHVFVAMSEPPPETTTTTTPPPATTTTTTLPATTTTTAPSNAVTSTTTTSIPDTTTTTLSATPNSTPTVATAAGAPETTTAVDSAATDATPTTITDASPPRTPAEPNCTGRRCDETTTYAIYLGIVTLAGAVLAIWAARG